VKENKINGTHSSEYVRVHLFLYFLQDFLQEAVSLWSKRDIFGFVKAEDSDSIRKESPMHFYNIT